MYLKPYFQGRYWEFMLIHTGTEPTSRCEVLQQMNQAKRDGKFKVAKVDAKIERIVDEPLGLGWLAETGDHPSHSARIDGHDIDFWGITSGDYRLYAFAWGSRCVIAAGFATKKSQKTSKAARAACEAAARKVILATANGEI